MKETSKEENKEDPLHQRKEEPKIEETSKQENKLAENEAKNQTQPTENKKTEKENKGEKSSKEKTNSKGSFFSRFSGADKVTKRPKYGTTSLVQSKSSSNTAPPPLAKSNSFSVIEKKQAPSVSAQLPQSKSNTHSLQAEKQPTEKSTKSSSNKDNNNIAKDASKEISKSKTEKEIISSPVLTASSEVKTEPKTPVESKENKNLENTSKPSKTSFASTRSLIVVTTSTFSKMNLQQTLSSTNPSVEIILLSLANESTKNQLEQLQKEIESFLSERGIKQIQLKQIMVKDEDIGDGTTQIIFNVAQQEKCDFVTVSSFDLKETKPVFSTSLLTEAPCPVIIAK